VKTFLKVWLGVIGICLIFLGGLALLNVIFIFFHRWGEKGDTVFLFLCGTAFVAWVVSSFID